MVLAIKMMLQAVGKMALTRRMRQGVAREMALLQQAMLPITLQGLAVLPTVLMRRTMVEVTQEMREEAGEDSTPPKVEAGEAVRDDALLTEDSGDCKPPLTLLEMAITQWMMLETAMERVHLRQMMIERKKGQALS